MIVSLDGLCVQTLPQVKIASNICGPPIFVDPLHIEDITIANTFKFCLQLEDYLLSLGWDFLQGSTDSSSTVDLKVCLKTCNVEMLNVHIN